MYNRQTPELPRYALECSRTALGSYVLARLNESANLRKQAAELIRTAVEAEAKAMFAAWVECFGEEVVCGTPVAATLACERLREPAALPPRSAAAR